MNDLNHPSNNEADHLVSEILCTLRGSGTYPRDDIDHLAALVLSKDETVAIASSRALFRSLVEPLSDAFEPADVSLYNRVFTQIVEACRRTERGRALDQQLSSFHLPNEASLLLRVERLRRTQRCAIDLGGVRRVLVLSRVTLGADLAVTSVILERLGKELPAAEIILVGSPKARELFSGNGRLSYRDINYERRGPLLDRLHSWLDVVAVVHEFVGHLKHGEAMILDPDSRLTQLGILPVTASDDPSLADDYFFFPSRELGYETRRSIAEVTSDWLNVLFGGAGQTFPTVCPSASSLEAAGTFVQRLNQAKSRPLVIVNFGIGGNPLKRLGDTFEATLITALLRTGARVLLDKGSGQRADAVIDRVMRMSEALAIRRIELTDERQSGMLASDLSDHDFVVWRGGIGMFAALIAESDLYVGYDSSGQHIAAALGVPCIDIMAGYSSQRMTARWRPTGPGSVHVVCFDTQNPAANTDTALTDAMRYARQILEM